MLFRSVLLLPFALLVQAQTYPAKPIRAIVAFGVCMLMARLVRAIVRERVMPTLDAPLPLRQSIDAAIVVRVLLALFLPAGALFAVTFDLTLAVLAAPAAAQDWSTFNGDLRALIAAERTSALSAMAASKVSQERARALDDYLGDMATDIEAARLLTWRSSWMHDQGQRATLQSSHAKRFAAGKDGQPSASVSSDEVYSCGKLVAQKLEMKGADYAIVGEGEQAFVRLLAALESGRGGSSVPGVIGGADEVSLPAQTAARFGASGRRRQPWRWTERGPARASS